MKRFLSLILAVAAGGVLCGVVRKPAQAATNSLTSVLSVDGSSGWWHCGYQGVISFTDQRSVARVVRLYVDGQYDGFASYLQKQGTDAIVGILPLGIPNNWDYHGKSDSMYMVGTQHSVYTVAQYWNPSQGTGYVTSNTRTWISGN